MCADDAGHSVERRVCSGLYASDTAGTQGFVDCFLGVRGAQAGIGIFGEERTGHTLGEMLVLDTAIRR